MYPERLFRGKLDTGARICLTAERAASGFGTEVGSSRWVTLNDIRQNEVRTIGEIRIVVSLGYGQKWYMAPFHVVPERFVRGRFDALLSNKLTQRMGLLVLGPTLPEKQEGIHEGSEELDKEYTGTAVEREGLDVLRAADRYVDMSWKHCLLLSTYLRRRTFICTLDLPCCLATLPPGTCPAEPVRAGE